MWTICDLSWIATARRFAANPHTFSLHLDIDGFCLLSLCYHMISDIAACCLLVWIEWNIKMGSYLALTFRPRTPLTPSSCDNQVFQISFPPPSTFLLALYLLTVVLTLLDWRGGRQEEEEQIQWRRRTRLSPPSCSQPATFSRQDGSLSLCEEAHRGKDLFTRHVWGKDLSTELVWG